MYLKNISNIEIKFMLNEEYKILQPKEVIEVDQKSGKFLLNSYMNGLVRVSEPKQQKTESYEELKEKFEDLKIKEVKKQDYIDLLNNNLESLKEDIDNKTIIITDLNNSLEVKENKIKELEGNNKKKANTKKAKKSPKKEKK